MADGEVRTWANWCYVAWVLNHVLFVLLCFAYRTEGKLFCGDGHGRGYVQGIREGLRRWRSGCWVEWMNEWMNIEIAIVFIYFFLSFSWRERGVLIVWIAFRNKIFFFFCWGWSHSSDFCSWRITRQESTFSFLGQLGSCTTRGTCQRYRCHCPIAKK